MQHAVKRKMLYLVKLINGDDHLADTETSDKKQMLSSLAASLESGFKLANSSVHHQKRAICLRCSRDHVRYEVPVPRRVQDSNFAVGSAE